MEKKQQKQRQLDESNKKPKTKTQKNKQFHEEPKKNFKNMQKQRQLDESTKITKNTKKAIP